MTTALIVLPLTAALVVWLLPLPARVAGGLALAAMLAETALWGVAVARFDFGESLQLVDRQTWFSDLGVSYHVGFFGFSLWLAGVSIVVCTAAIAYAWWARRERARAYHGLLLFLTGAIVGVFAAQDLLVFYVFFEAMLIPLYVLIGVWGGVRRVQATVKFVIYTMAGSLLMLASIVVLGLSQGTFDLVESGRSDSVWIFLGFLVAFAVKAPLFPFHGWLVDAYRESPPELSAILSGVVSKAAVYGLLRIGIAKFGEPVQDLQLAILVLAAVGLVYASLLAFRARDVRTVVAYSSMGQMSLIVMGLFSLNEIGVTGSIVHSVAHGLVSAALFLLAGMVEARTGGTSDFARIGGFAKGRPAFATLVLIVGVIALAVPGSAIFAGEFLILTGIYDQGWWWSAIGAGAIVLAAMYMLRAISGILHRSRELQPPAGTRDLRPAELGVLVPLVAALLFLSAWPASISERSFPPAPEEAAEVTP
jgi:NADH-quinone oxidoreductase subunit M